MFLLSTDVLIMIRDSTEDTNKTILIDYSEKILENMKGNDFIFDYINKV